MSSLFSEARAKIARANQHIRDIKARIDALHKTDTSRVEIHPQFGTESLIHDFADPTAFSDLALMLADAIHNLNCALDYTWFRAASRLVPAIVNDRTKFPVRETVKELEGWLKSPGKKHAAIHDLCPDLYRFLLDEIHPYSGGNYAIWPVHVLGNTDKHRLLTPVLAAGDIRGIVVADQNGESWPANAIGTIQEPPYIVDFEPGIHVKEKGKLSAWILVKHINMAHQLRLPQTLSHYSSLMVQVVESFESFLKLQGLAV